MTEEEFKKSAKYLVEKYVVDASIAKRILTDIDKLGSPAAKGILSDICENAGEIDDTDGKIIKDIAFYFV